jgi:phosphoglycolate phosphatase
MSAGLVIWDVDGTLIDSRAIIQRAMEDAFGACGERAPDYDDVRRLVGLPLETVIARLAPWRSGKPLETLTQAYREAFHAQRGDPGYREPLYAGALDMLSALQVRGFRQAVATGKARRGLEMILDMHPELRGFFASLHCADDGPGKPDPFMVREALRVNGAQAERAVMVGDAVHDMAMARAAGIGAHGVAWGFGRADELEAAGAHAVHEDFAGLGAALTSGLEVGA